jgi:hypothetical protein
MFITFLCLQEKLIYYYYYYIISIFQNNCIIITLYNTYNLIYIIFFNEFCPLNS